MSYAPEFHFQGQEGRLHGDLVRFIFGSLRLGEAVGRQSQ